MKYSLFFILVTPLSVRCQKPNANESSVELKNEGTSLNESRQMTTLPDASLPPQNSEQTEPPYVIYAHDSDLPWVATIHWISMVNDSHQYHRCGGSVITDQIVLTTCGCLHVPTSRGGVETARPKRTIVYSGYTACNSSEDSNYEGEQRDVRLIALHPMCDIKFLLYDFAIVEVFAKFITSRFLYPIHPFLETRKQYHNAIDRYTKEKIMCRMGSCGEIRLIKSSDGQYSAEMAKSVKFTGVRLLSPEECEKAFYNSSKRFYPAIKKLQGICIMTSIGDDQLFTCAADRGSAVVCGENILVGMLSWGTQCALSKGLPAVLVPIEAARSFLDPLFPRVV